MVYASLATPQIILAKAVKNTKKIKKLRRRPRKPKEKS
jgi:hypothetical protein